MSKNKMKWHDESHLKQHETNKKNMQCGTDTKEQEERCVSESESKREREREWERSEEWKGEKAREGERAS